jgi:hypothetical protein
VHEIVRPTIGADGRPRWLGDTDGGKFEDTDHSEGKFEDADKDTDGPSETLEPIETQRSSPLICRRLTLLASLARSHGDPCINVLLGISANSAIASLAHRFAATCRRVRALP